MYSRTSCLLLLLLLPVVVAFPAQPSSDVLHPRHIHQTFLELKARRIRRIRRATVKLASHALSRTSQLQVSSRAGLAFEPCSAAGDCQGERACVQLAGSTSNEVDIVDCDNGICFCADTDGCSSNEDCLTGETCAAGGTCLSNAFVPGVPQVDQVDPTLGLNLDPCQSISDCQNPRNCVQVVAGVFGQCAGPNCFCVRPDPSCTSASECSDGESCTQREGSNNAICISETAIINGEATEEEIEELPDSATELPPMPDMMPAGPAPDAEGTESPETPESPQTPETPDTPDVIPVPLPGTDEGEEGSDTPDAGSGAPEGTTPEDTTAEDITPADTGAAEPAPGSPTTPEETEPEQADREPGVVLPGADGADMSPDTEEGEEVVPSDTDPDVGPTLTEEGDGDMLPSPDGSELIEPGVSSTPDVEVDGEIDDDMGPTPSPEEVICIGEHHLGHMPRDELLYSSNRVARVLCDENNSCATPGHIVMYNDKPMMMSSYCSNASCAPKIMKVNSPRYRRAARVDSHTEGLSFTAFAARYETSAEEHLLRTFVRMGL